MNSIEAKKWAWESLAGWGIQQEDKSIRCWTFQERIEKSNELVEWLLKPIDSPVSE